MKRASDISIIVNGIGVVVTLCVTGLLYVLVIAPLWHERQNRSVLAKELAARQAEWAQNERATRAVAGQISKTNEAVERTSLTLQSPAKINEHLANLVEVASRCGVQIDSIQPGNSSPGTKLRGLSIQVRGKGRYSAIHEFFANVREKCPDTSIRNFNLAADGSANPPVALLNAELFWITLPEAGVPDVQPK